MQEIVITVVGNIVSEVRCVTQPDGVARASFRVAFNRRRFDRASERFVDLDTSYFGVTCWRELAENVAWSMHKGDPVVVHGRLRIRDREDGGQQRRYVDIEADSVGHNLRWGTSMYRRQRRLNPAETTAVVGDVMPPEAIGGPVEEAERLLGARGEAKVPAQTRDGEGPGEAVA